MFAGVEFCQMGVWNLLPRLAVAGPGHYRTVFRGTPADMPDSAFSAPARVPSRLCVRLNPGDAHRGLVLERRRCTGSSTALPRLLLDLMVHDMMLHRILRVCRGPRRSRRTELRHEGIGACRIRIALLAFIVAAGHGGAAEAEKDCDSHYAESFHLKSPSLRLIRRCRPLRARSMWPSGGRH
jgi:hypothetical protein